MKKIKDWLKQFPSGQQFTMIKASNVLSITTNLNGVTYSIQL